jgi:hypothetical protein
MRGIDFVDFKSPASESRPDAYKRISALRGLLIMSVKESFDGFEAKH